MNWTRAQLKSNARLMIKKNRLQCIVVSLVLALLGGLDFSIHYNFTESYEGSGLSSFAQSLGGIPGMAARLWSEFWPGGLILIPVLVFIVVVAAIVALAISIFIGNVLQVGGARFYLHNIHSQGDLGDLAFGFQNMYGNVVKVMFFRELYIWLWSLLLVIPGIVKSYQYRLVPYLLADNPELTTGQALDMSRDMMYGEKWNAFILDWSFFLWNFLSSITFGIAGLLWVNPYVDATNAELYTALKAKGIYNW